MANNYQFIGHTSQTLSTEIPSFVVNIKKRNYLNFKLNANLWIERGTKRASQKKN